MNKVIDVAELNFNIDFYAKELRKGKIFVLPTGTIYGICTNALNQESVKKIYKIKNRNLNKPLIILVNDYDMLKKVCFDLNETEHKIVNRFWPGPLTMILKKKTIIPNIVTSNNYTVGVRIDSSKIINTLIEKSGVPIVAPSANISGKLNIDSIKLLESEVTEKVDYIIDAGVLGDVIESTIVKVEDNNIEILREGKISKREILNLR